jgi:hypothetical protein
MEEKFEQWCLVELYGHNRIVGKVTEATIGGCSFVRVDVPETENQKAFTRYFGNASIYSLNPISKEVADELLKQYALPPVNAFQITRLQQPAIEQQEEEEYE